MNNYVNQAYKKIKALNSALPQLKTIRPELEIEVSQDFNELYIKNFEESNHFLNLEWNYGIYTVTDHSLPNVIKFAEPSTVSSLVKQFYEVNSLR